MSLPTGYRSATYRGGGTTASVPATYDKGRLREHLDAERTARGLTMGDLTVLSSQRDPFRLDTLANHRDARLGKASAGCGRREAQIEESPEVLVTNTSGDSPPKKRGGKYATRADSDGRPLVVLTFADCDPSGWQMPVSIARKLQALQVALFPGLRFEVHRVGLTPEHVRDYGLPSTPLKATEQRADRWRAAMGVQQTEIDALASLQPGVFDALARGVSLPALCRHAPYLGNMYSGQDVKAMRRLDHQIRNDLRLDGPLESADYASLLSLFPADTPAEVAVALAHLWMDRLALIRELHDLHPLWRGISADFHAAVHKALQLLLAESAAPTYYTDGRLWENEPPPDPWLHAIVMCNAPHGPDLHGVPVAA